MFVRVVVFFRSLFQFFIGSLRIHGTSPELSLHKSNSVVHFPKKAEMKAGRRKTPSPPRSGPIYNTKIAVQSKDPRIRSQTMRFLRCTCIKNKEQCEVCSKPDCMKCSNYL